MVPFLAELGKVGRPEDVFINYVLRSVRARESPGRLVRVQVALRIISKRYNLQKHSWVQMHLMLQSIAVTH